MRNKLCYTCNVQKIHLSKHELQELVFDTRYKLDEEKESMNIDLFSVVVSAGQSYGFEVDKEETAKIINEVTGRLKTFNQDDNFDGAIVQIIGNYSIQSTFSIESAEGNRGGKLFIYHQTAINKTYRKLSEKLIQNEAVKLFPGCDKEYLYEVLSDVTESHFYEISKKRASELPMYLVEFDENGGFNITDMGKMT